MLMDDDFLSHYKMDLVNRVFKIAVALEALEALDWVGPRNGMLSTEDDFCGLKVWLSMSAAIFKLTR